jgi:hypothetical protein
VSFVSLLAGESISQFKLKNILECLMLVSEQHRF